MSVKQTYKIVIAPDSFKESISAQGFCQAATRGIESLNLPLEIISVPLADGGEGTSEILTSFFKGKTTTKVVQNPFFSATEAMFGISADGKMAFIDMAAASGIALIPTEKRNCYYTTTYGTGELIAEALKLGVNEIILGLGSSATNDGGVGVATALGYKFLDKWGDALVPIGENLCKIKTIDQEGVSTLLKDVKFIAACDVQNPFYGPNGAAFAYGAQKGASSDEIEKLDKGLQNLAAVIKKDLGKDIAQIKGAGAAGGMGGGAIAFLNGELKSGVDLMMNILGLEKAIQQADLVITGEGKIDEQTINGKLVKGVAAVAHKYGKKTIAFCGKLDISASLLDKMHLHYASSIINSPISLKTALSSADYLIEKKTAEVVRFWYLMEDKT